MHLSQVKALLAEAEEYLQPASKKSIFDVGARGYFENPTTDLLGFFLDPGQEHGLDDCFLRALLNCVGGKDLPAKLEPDQRRRREVSTANRNRMDLLLCGVGWGLLLENKIFSDQNNPFSDYEKHFDKMGKEKKWKRRMRVILSPSGESQPKWTPLTYGCLIAAVREQLEQYDPQALDSQELNRWRVLATEFLLHLENLTVEREMRSEAVKFALERVLPHVCALNKLLQFNKKAIEILNARIVQSLQKAGCKPDHQYEAWPEGPALRYSHSDWYKDAEIVSEVVLYLSIQAGCLRPLVQVYLVRMNDDLEQQVCEEFTFPPPRDKERSKNSVSCFEWSFDEFEEQSVVDAVVGKMKIVMDFEKLRT